MQIKSSLLFLASLIFITTLTAQKKSKIGLFKDSNQINTIPRPTVISYFSKKWQSDVDSLIKINPLNANLWQAKATPYLKCRKYEVSIQYLDKVVLINPKE